MVNGCEAETPTQGETGNRKGCCGATLLQVTGDSHQGIGDSGVGFQPSAIGSWFLRLIPERLEPELPATVPSPVTRNYTPANLPVSGLPLSLNLCPR